MKLSLLLLLILTSLSMLSAAPSCEVNPSQVANNCTFGTLQYCRQQICARGNGQDCDLHPLSAERCGLGYFCVCGKCQGCSLITLADCFYDTTNCIDR
uniref:Neuroparsin larval externa type n=1 Tax=Parasacculina yatsui TaxID=2836420 RepID=A0A482KL47_9CRUS|nr:neuroparsin larval externa type [Parasacculina yatsui]